MNLEKKEFMTKNLAELLAGLHDMSSDALARKLMTLAIEAVEEEDLVVIGKSDFLRLQHCCSTRGARMQILNEVRKGNQEWDPTYNYWFDNAGVPL